MKNIKNILITAAGSDIAKSLINYLKTGAALGKFDGHIFASYRKNPPEGAENFTPFYLDMCDDASFLNLNNFLDENYKDIKFDAVVNFAGAALTSPVSKLSADMMKYQLDVSVVGLTRLLSFITPYLHKKSRIINVSSMASFGIFPFISPYCISKASSDILLNAYEIETGIRTVSIKPGVVKTKFWEYCIDLNKANFKNFEGEYKDTGDFLLDNAKKNANKGLEPICVAKVIFKALTDKYPRHSYLAGNDALIASFSRFVPKRILNPLIRRVLACRVKRYKENYGK